MFDIQIRDGGVLHVRGRLDASQAARAEALLAGVDTSAEVDLAGLDYISSAGIAVLVKTQLRLQGRGHKLQLVNVQPRVRSVFHYAGLDDLFGIE